MKESIGRDRYPDGSYIFRVVGVPEKVFTRSGKPQRVWILKSSEGKDFMFWLFPNKYQDIVLALGGEKVKGKVEWDDEQVSGKMFSCELKTVVSGDFENYVFNDCKPIADADVEGIPF